MKDRGARLVTDSVGERGQLHKGLYESYNAIVNCRLPRLPGVVRVRERVFLLPELLYQLCVFGRDVVVEHILVVDRVELGRLRPFVLDLASKYARLLFESLNLVFDDWKILLVSAEDNVGLQAYPSRTDSKVQQSLLGINFAFVDSDTWITIVVSPVG